MGPDTSRRLFPLTSCSIGIWTPAEGSKPYLLLCPDRKQFVILLTQDLDVRSRRSSNGSLSVNALLACARNQAGLWLRHKNPFIDHTPSSDSAVLTFEVSFDNVVGMDFRWPLTDEPRLVLETASLTKQVFGNVEEVCQRYPPVRHSRFRASLQGHTAADLQSVQQQQQQERGLGDHIRATAVAAKLHRKQQLAAAGADAAGVIGAAVGDGANSVAGTMSRVSSWTSWASWTLGSARNSLEGFAAPPTVQPLAAAVAAAAEVPPHDMAEAPSSSDGTGGTAVTGTNGRPGSWDVSHAAHRGSAMQQQAAQAAAETVTVAASSSQAAEMLPDCGSACGSHASSGADALDSMVSLSLGIAGTAAAAQQLPAGKDGACNCPAGPALCCQPLAGSSSNSNSEGVAKPAAGVAADPEPWHMFQPARTGSHAAAEVSPAPSGLSTPIMAGAASDTGASDCMSTLCQGPEASFDHWQLPRSGVHSLLLQMPCRGAVTAPCSMPNSPRVACGEGVLLPGSSSSPGHIAAQVVEQLQRHQQQQQQLCEQPSQQPAGQRHKLQGQLCSSGGSVVSRRSNRSRLATATDRACPLCHQTLMQPLPVVQQHFHEQQDYKHLRVAARHNSKSSRVLLVPRSRSACSLQQLQQLQDKASASTAAAGDGTLRDRCLHIQNQQAKQQQVDQQQLSPRSFAGLAAAAIGVLAARCRPGGLGSTSISRHGSRLAELQDGGLNEKAASTCHQVAEPKLDAAATAAETPAAGAASPDTALQGTSCTGQMETAMAAQTGTAAATPANAAGMQSLHEFSRVHAVDAGASAKQSSSQSAFGTDYAQHCGQGEADAAVVVGKSSAAGADSKAAKDAAPEGGVQAAEQAALEADAAGAAAAVSGTAGASHPQQTSQAAGNLHAVYGNRTVVLTFRDPTLPYQLSKLVKNQDNVHLLKLYESGLPSWAIVLPSYGLWYRPWLRRVTWLLFVLLSVISMAMGFYDLWKNVPYFKQFVVGMFRPAAAVFEWLEGHTQIRLSILLTYMVGKSQLLVEVMKLLTQASLQSLLAPFMPLVAFASSVGSGIAWLLQPFITAGNLLFGPIGRLLWLVLQLLWRLISTVLWFGPLQLLQLLLLGLQTVLQLLLMPLQLLMPAASGLRAGWTAAKATGQMARTAAPIVAEAARGAHSASSSWSWWNPLEALELMRVSTVRVVKALQAVLRFFVTLATTINQHRLSLMMQLRGKLLGGLQAAASSPAGRVASAVAEKIGQGERLKRVQRTVTRRLHRNESLTSMSSEALLMGMAAFGPAGLGHQFSIGSSRAFSMDGGPELLQETADRADGGDDAEDDSEVNSALSWHPSLAAPSPAKPYSSSAGLRLRAAAAAAAASAGSASGSYPRRSSFSTIGSSSSRLAAVQHAGQEGLLHHLEASPPAEAAEAAASVPMEDGFDDTALLQQHLPSIVKDVSTHSRRAIGTGVPVGKQVRFTQSFTGVSSNAPPSTSLIGSTQGPWFTMSNGPATADVLALSRSHEGLAGLPGLHRQQQMPVAAASAATSCGQVPTAGAAGAAGSMPTSIGVGWPSAGGVAAGRVLSQGGVSWTQSAGLLMVSDARTQREQLLQDDGTLGFGRLQLGL